MLRPLKTNAMGTYWSQMTLSAPEKSNYMNSISMNLIRGSDMER